MSLSRSELLRWQFEFTWSLFEYHLERLEPGDSRWEPAPRCWTVRPDSSGGWVPDWAEPEPDPVPVPTVGWVSWHIGWWWGVTLDHAQGRTPRERTEVGWPGEESVVEWLRALRTEWLTVLDGLTDRKLEEAAPFPWPADSGYTVAHMVAWVNSELMKNAAEIGQLRLLRTASS